jgi:hypothetical protein
MLDNNKNKIMKYILLYIVLYIVFFYFFYRFFYPPGKSVTFLTFFSIFPPNPAPVLLFRYSKTFYRSLTIVFARLIIYNALYSPINKDIMPRLSKEEELKKWLRNYRYYLAEIDFKAYKSTVIVMVDTSLKNDRKPEDIAKEKVINEYPQVLPEDINIIGFPQAFII